MSIYEMHFLWK
jgi:hypothetical protein